MGRSHPDQGYVWVSENDSMKLALGEMWELRQKNLISRVSCSLKMIYWPGGMLDERDCAIFVKYSLNLLAITSSPSTFSPLIYLSSIDVFTSLGLRIDLMTCQVFFRSLLCF